VRIASVRRQTRRGSPGLYSLVNSRILIDTADQSKYNELCWNATRQAFLLVSPFRRTSDFLKVDDEVRVKVISVKDGKIGLSIKQASPEYSVSIAAGRRPSDRGPRRAARSSASFEEKISKFLKDSEDRLSDLNRNTESKRGGRGSRYYR